MTLTRVFHNGGLLLPLLFLLSCALSPGTQSDVRVKKQEADVAPSQASAEMKKPQLPLYYRSPSWSAPTRRRDGSEITAEESDLKVGVSIRSARGPQPLRAILKRLAALKGMNVSWASDVDRTTLVDVDISADDSFCVSVENLLRQAGYFHEISDNTIIVRYRETRSFHIAMPFTKQSLTTSTGGNVLGSDEASSNIDGTIELESSENVFDVWGNIQANMDAILAAWDTSPTSGKTAEAGAKEAQAETQQAAGRVSNGRSMYIIDKPVGLVTVTAPRPLLDRLEEYFARLKRHLYKQISIEAKIIEVALTNDSHIGLDWSSLLQDFRLTANVEFGAAGQIYPRTGDFISTVSLSNATFLTILNALEEQGEINILSSPKLSVLNGQPSLITVGRNITYLESVEVDRDTESNESTITTNTERILSGVGLALTATVLGDDEVVMNLVPVISELELPIDSVEFGQYGTEVGLPVINVREMSTTVRVRDGEMLVIGGLTSSANEVVEEFAPVAGKIPIVRYLFGHKEITERKRELVILLRPRII